MDSNGKLYLSKSSSRASSIKSPNINDEMIYSKATLDKWADTLCSCQNPPTSPQK